MQFALQTLPWGSRYVCSSSLVGFNTVMPQGDRSVPYAGPDAYASVETRGFVCLHRRRVIPQGHGHPACDLAAMTADDSIEDAWGTEHSERDQHSIGHYGDEGFSILVLVGQQRGQINRFIARGASGTQARTTRRLPRWRRRVPPPPWRPALWPPATLGTPSPEGANPVDTSIGSLIVCSRR